MTKYFLVFLSMFLIQSATGQDNFRIHYKVLSTDRILTLNQPNAQQSIIKSEREVDEKPALGFDIGIQKFWDMSSHLRVGTGMSYARYGYKQKVSEGLLWPTQIDSFLGNPPVPSTIKPSIYNNYLAIPITIEYSTGGKFSINPYFSLLNQIYFNSLVYWDTDIGVKSNYGKDKKAKIFNLAAEAGISIAYTHKHFVPSIGLVYNHQLFKAIDDKIDEKFFAYGLTFSIKYMP